MFAVTARAKTAARWGDTPAGFPPRRGWIATALLVSLLVASPSARGATDLETVAQVRRDLFGQWMLPAYELVRVTLPGDRTSVDALAAVEWTAGVERAADLDVYYLSWAREGERADLSVGRLRAIGALRPQTLDGVRLDVPLGGALTIESWAGWARHQDLADLLDGAGMGRLGLRLVHGGVAGRLGVETEVGPEVPLLLRQDVEVSAEARGGKVRPGVSARAVVAEPLGAGGGAVPEWLEVEGSLHPGAGFETLAHARHRAAADPGSLFGDAVLDALSGGAVQELGGKVRWTGSRWSSISASYTSLFYARDAGAVPGHGVDAAWRSPRGELGFVVIPSYTWRTGPGGSYHAVAITEHLPLGDATRLDLREGVVPYQKVDEPWDLAATAGLDVGRNLGRMVRCRGSVEVASDAFNLLDARGGLALEVLLP